MSPGRSHHVSSALTILSSATLIACIPSSPLVRSGSARYLSRRSGLSDEIPFRVTFRSLQWIEPRMRINPVEETATGSSPEATRSVGTKSS